MNLIDLRRFANSYEVIPPTSSAQPAPDATTPVIRNTKNDTVRTYIKYEGTVTECEIRLYYFDGRDWFKALSTAEAAPLIGSGFGNEVRDWEVGEQARFTFRVEKVSGGGSVSVRVTEGNHRG